MTGFISILALAVSSAAILYLRATDAKRRRVFGLEPVERRWPRLVKTALWLPGIVLIALGNTAGLLIWLGGVTVIGWGVAAMTPAAVDAARMRADAWRDTALARIEGPKQQLIAGAAALWAMRSRLPSLPIPAQRDEASSALAERVTALEARIAELEEALADRDRAALAEQPVHALGAPPEPPSLVVAGGRS